MLHIFLKRWKQGKHFRLQEIDNIILMTPGFMGILFTVARIWDGVNDLMWGTIVDRTKSKYGRFRPWILRSSFILAIVLVLSFTVPNFSANGKMIYAAIFYIIFDMVFTTLDISYWGLPAAMSSDPNERNKIFAWSTTASNAISTISSIIIPILLVNFGGETNAGSFFKVAMVIGIFALVMYLICFALVREHVTPANAEKFSVKLALKNIYVNKPLFCVMIANLVTHFVPDMATENFKAIIPLQHEKELLQIYGNIPCMLLERFVYEKETLVEYTRSVIRGDKYIFSVDLK